eukprot:11649298-Heterocapsa_arctica.AAC.1
MPQEKATEINNNRHFAWTFIIWNLDIQFPPGDKTLELNWILKEIGGYCDADILSMASNRQFFARTISSISNSYAEANRA